MLEVPIDSGDEELSSILTLCDVHAGLIVTTSMTYLDDKIASYDTDADRDEQLWSDIIVSASFRLSLRDRNAKKIHVVVFVERRSGD